MKKLLLVVGLAAAVAFGIWFQMHGGSNRTSSAAVTTLLPKETLAFVHLPDVNGARAKWHETDLYKLWREPAVQDFLQRPLSHEPKHRVAAQRLQEIGPLEIRDVFFAVTSWEKPQLRMVGGFRFKGSPEDVERVLGEWRNRSGQTETVEYEQHRITVTTADSLTLATTYSSNWFYAANDVAALKALLDRADRRATDKATLGADEEFILTSKHMPGSYIARVFGRLDRYFASFTPPPGHEIPAEAQSLLKKLRSFSATTSIENGKVRDVLFVGMPKIEGIPDLTRNALPLATRDSFLYIASIFRLPQELPASTGAGASGGVATAQQILGTVAAAGVTREQWDAAFGPELSWLGNWPEQSRFPHVFATLGVKDSAKAGELVAKLTAAAAEEDAAWSKTEKDGVQLYTQPPISPMLPVAVTIGLSRERLVLGHEPAAVEALLGRGASSGSELTTSTAFKTAERLLPAATNSFAYIDTALLYTRVDAALRPMIIMAAAFLPSLAQTVDLGKLPPPEIITKHLSPIVTSGRYQDNGYVVESVGPVSLYQGAVGAAALTGLGASLYQKSRGGFANPLPTFPGALSIPVPSPDASPEETPDE